MDVTALLNSNSGLAAGQQKVAEKEKSQKEKSTTPPRNRTPWDAGGYSLPINTLSSTFSSAAQPCDESDSPKDNSRHENSLDSPASPKHKFSDSRSSLSSFTTTSSHHSTTHSRFSSMSTVASNHLVNDKIPQDSRRTTPQPQTFGSPKMSTDSTGIENRARSSLSPTGSLETLAVAAERRQSRQEQDPVSPMQETTDAMATTNISPMDEAANGMIGYVESSPRPGSPSDAILIKRASVPSLKLNTGDVSTPDQAQQSSMYLSAPLEHQGHPAYTGGHSRHKRAVSAPDFPPNMVTDFARRGSASFGATAEPTPPPSHHPDHQSPAGPMRYTIPPDTPPATTADLESQPIVCMYIENCDTGSQPRKAISHIFGRNKMCTRLIPQHVWVHYCRKHYQRSRYRNPKEYAKLQCDLVELQIQRVHEWSEENKRRGEPGVVQDWGLAVRKREQKRLDELAGGNRKRRAPAFDGNDSDDGENGAGAQGNSSSCQTAVPQWLLDDCGKGYQTDAILTIFRQLSSAIFRDELPCFPDIEILPNIVVDQEEPKSPKGYAKRKAFPGSHKRSQSLGVMKPTYYPQPTQGRRPSLPQNNWVPNEMYQSSPPVQKRRRPNDMMDFPPEPGMMQFQRSRMPDRAMEAGRRLQTLPHRPVFANIEEHQADEMDYREPQGRAAYYSHSPSQAYSRAPLPAPTAQRLHAPSMAAHLETNNEDIHAAKRPMHQRSQSDMGSFQRAPMGYGQAPPSGYGMSSNYQNPQASMIHRAQEQPNGYSYPPPQPQHQQPRYQSPVRQHPYAEPRTMRPMSGSGHSRHQSTPMIPQQHFGHHAQQMPSQIPQGYSQYPNQNVYRR